jgi:hypothetical protein
MMKNFTLTIIILVLMGFGTTLLAQNSPKESLGLPGDNLNLYAVMKLFQESETLEAFEKNLNDQNSHINNLDLNGDNIVDYIRVIDNIDRDVHTIVLQVAINRTQNQDVAVFTVQQEADGKVYIQLIGDEALYGKNYIIEPYYTAADSGQTPNPGYMGNTQTIDGREIVVTRTSMSEVASWPLIRFIFMPNYSRWRSSWYFDYYPSYWHPWHPYYWDYYYGYQYNWYNNYYSNYRRVEYNHYTRWNDFYYNDYRARSLNVQRNMEAGKYRTTYSHPDQRKDGIALYNKTHVDRPSNLINERRSGTPTTTERRSAGPVPTTTRRATETVPNRTVTNPATNQNVNTTRSNPKTVTNRTETRPATQPSTQQNATPARRAPENATNRTESRPAAPAREVATRPVRQAPATQVNAPARREAPAKPAERPAERPKEPDRDPKRR